MEVDPSSNTETTVVTVPEHSDPGSRLDAPARAVRNGELVGFPTETVYGIAANERDRDAVDRLLAIRNSPSDKKLTVHISDTSDLWHHCPSPPPLAARLAERFWPGPLTMVLPHSERGTIGLRLPDHRISRQLIRKAGVPVVAPSANISGQDPAINADQVLEVFDGTLAYVIDGGTVPGGTSSTVVRIRESDSFEVLREGALSPDRIAEETGIQVLFVCTGNTCRSPMAAELLQKLWNEDTSNQTDRLRIRSAGIQATEGRAAAKPARNVIREEYRRSLDDHTTQPLHPDLIRQSDLIYVMKPRHRTCVEEMVPEAADRTRLLNRSGGGIDDPVGGTYESYCACARQIHDALRTVLREEL